MILCLDVGNTQIHGGVFNNDKLTLQFRKSSRETMSSDEFGVFLRAVLRENGIGYENIKQVVMCTVVPRSVYSFRSACIKYFHHEPFMLEPGVKTGLKIKYRNPVEVGADRIANAIASTQLYPNKNIIAIDFGTATTFDVITKDKDYLGGVILPGVRISMESLASNAAKLQTVEIVEPQQVVGRSTRESIQSGLFYGQLGTVKELTKRITDEAFQDEKPVIIGTGGFSTLFENQGLFDAIHPDLVLQGLKFLLNMNS